MTTPVVVAAGAVVRRGDRLLLIQRGRAPEAGRWSVPGGRVEAGEGLRDAVRREVLEETGLDVDVGDLVGVVERRGPGFHYVVADFAAACAPDAEPTAGDDAAAVAWVPASDLDEWDLVDGLRTFLRANRIG
ncbi:MAG: NUDIX domain-containing protein [Actinomycetota bacterium]